MKTAEQEAQSKGQSAVIRYWSNEIKDAQKRDKDYRKEGERIRKIYSGASKKHIPFNILYSNTETLAPACYSSTPKPIVQRRFKDPDEIGRASAMVGQRTLEFLLDTNIEGYETFDACMKDVVLDALLPGRGVGRVKYEADVAAIPQPQAESAKADDSVGMGEGAEPLPPLEQKNWESVCAEHVDWDRVYFGYAKKWSKVPWIAFEHFMDKVEAARMFGEEVANKMIFESGNEREDKWEGQRKSDDSNVDKERKTCLVYEIWKKRGKKVFFVAPNYQEGYLKEEDDPLELTGFYPMPKPIMFVSKTGDLNPTALYELYENQATELNKISVRINRIVDAIKVRGAYDGSLGETLENLMKGDDNTLIPTANASSIAIEGGLDKYIWFMPLNMLVAVLKELVAARNECKQVIYEVTGIADVLRGASDANETLGAQQLKNQWASMRIKMLQKEVVRYGRDMLRLMLEVAAKHFSPETFAQMTGLPFVTAEQKAQAQALLAAAQAEGQRLGVSLEQAPPQIKQTIDQAQATLKTPDWEAVIDLLKNDLQRAYRIDVETNSTIEANENEDKKNITEAMAALGQFIQGVTPLVEQGIMPFAAAKSMLLAIVRKFRFGTEVEEEIKSMQAPQQKPDPAAEAEKTKAAAEDKRTQADLQMMERKAQLESEQMARDAEYAAEEHRQKMAELAAKAEYNRLMGELKTIQLQQKVAAERAKPKQPVGAT